MNAPLTGLRIGLVTASASRLGGGVFEAVAAQAALIRRLGGEAPVFALEDRHSAEDAHRFAGSELVQCPIAGPTQIGYAPQLVPRLLAAQLDCLHLHGIWMYPSRAATQWASATRRRYIVSPHGMLDPWITARGRWKKALARIGYERASWRTASILHALTAAEAEEIRRESGRSDALIIPNPAPECADELQSGRAPIVAFIGRIHPKKNVLALVEGWRQARLHPEAQLQIAGWGEPRDLARLEAAVAAAGPSVRFLGPVYGPEKQNLLGRASFTILPSFGEGLPMAVLEGWAAGTPAILTANCNLPEGFTAGAALECGASPDGIARALEAALALDDQAWLAMARAAQGLARGPFSAASVAARWVAAYRDVAVSAPARSGLRPA
jgi:glycosyltransferase involved in cell wall biosynthesis